MKIITPEDNTKRVQKETNMRLRKIKLVKWFDKLLFTWEVKSNFKFYANEHGTLVYLRTSNFTDDEFTKMLKPYTDKGWTYTIIRNSELEDSEKFGYGYTHCINFKTKS